MTLRGSVLEDAIPSTAKHSTARGLPLKEVLEHVIPELNVQCLRLAFNTPKVTEQLMKLDEQGVSVASREYFYGSVFLLGFQNIGLDISFWRGQLMSFIVKDILFAITQFLLSWFSLHFSSNEILYVRIDIYGI